MAFWGDYHTHTVYSHGKGTVEDNVRAARDLGLKAIAITDHGICGYPQNMHPIDFEPFLVEIERCRELYPDMQILAGVEANLISQRGELDMPSNAEDKLDIILCGYHTIRIPDKISAMFKMWMPNMMPTKRRSARRAKNTDSYIRAMQDYRVSVIAHPLRQFPCDLKALGEAAKTYGVYIELNGKNCMFTPEDFDTLGKTGCEFICSSDAHDVSRIGDFSAVEKFEAAGLDKSLIANWERFPTLR